jgi:hypothetical protein
MNPETLKKCLSGNASKEEWIAYQQWLEGANEDDDLPEIDIEEGSDSRIWQQIQGENQKQDRFHKYKMNTLWGSVAASLVLISALLIFSQKQMLHSNQQMVFQSDSAQPFLEKEFKGLLMKLGTNSKVSMQSQIDNDINIQLSGNMMLSNTSAQDKYTQLLYTASDGHQISKKICLKKGQKYLLAYYPLKKDKLLVIENHVLMDMPPALVMNLKNDFDLL